MVKLLLGWELTETRWRGSEASQDFSFEVSVLTRSYFELIVYLLQNQDKKIVPSFVYK